MSRPGGASPAPTWRPRSPGPITRFFQELPGRHRRRRRSPDARVPCPAGTPCPAAAPRPTHSCPTSAPWPCPGGPGDMGVPVPANSRGGRSDIAGASGCHSRWRWGTRGRRGRARSVTGQCQPRRIPSLLGALPGLSRCHTVLPWPGTSWEGSGTHRAPIPPAVGMALAHGGSWGHTFSHLRSAAVRFGICWGNCGATGSGRSTWPGLRCRYPLYAAGTRSPTPSRATGLVPSGETAPAPQGRHHSREPLPCAGACRQACRQHPSPVPPRLAQASRLSRVVPPPTAPSGAGTCPARPTP